ncbi:discoidin domain-containing receptor 2-like [Euwallacea similis]|uniref:discoidin domain-containing receptor 2-like n=1 Tax=Euwallacea similis TaxID=1736056 RepID=UPI00344D7DAF
MSLQIPLFLALMSLSRGAQSTYHPINCSDPVGMQNRNIKDKDITASSFYTINLLPEFGRLKYEDEEGAWCPNHTDIGPWLQIDLHQRHKLTSIATQGRYAQGRGQEYVEIYTMQYYDSLQNKWEFYKNETNSEYMEGNEDTNNIKKNTFYNPIMANKVRIFPIKQHMTMCLRVELYGCLWPESVVKVDVSEGQGNLLENGKAFLFDDIIPLLNTDKGWMIWRNPTLQGRPFEISFQFDKIRAFQAVHLFVKEPFKLANITFSIDGEYYSNPLTWKPVEGTNLTYNLNNQIGKYLKIQFSAKEELLSLGEIEFDSSLNYYDYYTCHDTTERKILDDWKYIIIIIISMGLNVGFGGYWIKTCLKRKKPQPSHDEIYCDIDVPLRDSRINSERGIVVE